MKIKPMFLFVGFLLASFGTAAHAQLENLIEPPTEFEFSADTVDESVLAKRIDDLTAASNKHTEQICTLDERLDRLEKLLSNSVSNKRTSAPRLKSVLLPPKEISILSYAPIVSQPVVTYSPPIATSVSSPIYYSPPVATIVSNPIAPIVRSAYQAPVRPTISPPQQFTSSRIVRMPVQQNRSTTIEYSPTAPRRSLGNFFGVPGNCPGGVCPR